MHTSTTNVIIFGVGGSSIDNSLLNVMVFVVRALLIGLQNESWGRPIPTGSSVRALSHTFRTNAAWIHPFWLSAAS
jgi:hypothetical protein